MPDLKKGQIALYKGTLFAASGMTLFSVPAITFAGPELKRIYMGHSFLDVDLLVALIMTLPALFIALAAPFAGYMMDRFGRKIPLLIALITYAAAGSTGMWTEKLWIILAGRVILGISIAVILTGATTLIADTFEDEERQRAMGDQSAVMGFSAAIYLLAGGALAGISWQAPFSLYLLSLLAIPGVAITVKQMPGRKTRQQIRKEMKEGVRPDWRSLANVYGAALLGMAMLYLIPIELPFFLAEQGKYATIWGGVTAAILFLMLSAMALNYQRIRRVFKNLTLFSIVFFLIGGGFWILATSDNLSSVITASVISGLGFGILMPHLNVRTTELAPNFMRGRLVGGMTTAICLGQFLSPLVVMPQVRNFGYGGPFGAYGVTAMVALCIGILFAAMKIAITVYRFVLIKPEVEEKKNPSKEKEVPKAQTA